MILETATALTCLTYALYFEGRSESNLGMLAIGQTILNRVEDTRFPNTVCSVVTDGQRYSWNDQMVKHKCAFSFYCDGKDEVIRDEDAFDWAESLSFFLLDGGMSIDVTEGSTHYHATYIKQPYWAKDLTLTVCIDKHCFYRWEYSK